MYDIFTFIWLMFMVNVGKYTIHEPMGYAMILDIMMVNDIYIFFPMLKKNTGFLQEQESSQNPQISECTLSPRNENTYPYHTHDTWTNCSDLSRRLVTLNGGLVRESLQKCPDHSGLGIINSNLPIPSRPSLLLRFCRWYLPKWCNW